MRAHRDAIRTSDSKNWLKHIGKLGFPLQLLLKTYSYFIVYIDLWILFFRSWLAIFSSIFRVFFPTRLKNLSREVAMVVGSSRGVGRELALRLGAFNTIVICIDIQPSEIESVSRSIRENGGTAFYFQCDVTYREQVEAIARIELEVGEISMLFHCCSLPSPRSVVTNRKLVSLGFFLGLFRTFLDVFRTFLGLFRTYFRSL